MHRDLKPANCLVTPDGRAVVIDLGLAIDPERDERLTRTGAHVGTPQYMAPEQLSAASPSPRTDVHALGLILFELVSGRPAFHADTAQQLVGLVLSPERPVPSSVDASLPAALDVLLRRATALDPAARHADADALAADLDALRASPGRSVASARRRRLVALACAAALGVGLVGVLRGEAPGDADAPVAPTVAAVPTSSRPEPARVDAAEPVLDALRSGSVTLAIERAQRFDAPTWADARPRAAELHAALAARLGAVLESVPRGRPAQDDSPFERTLDGESVRRFGPREVGAISDLLRLRAELQERMGAALPAWPDAAHALAEIAAHQPRLAVASLVALIGRARVRAAPRACDAVFQGRSWPQDPSADTEAALGCLLALDVDVSSDVDVSDDAPTGSARSAPARILGVLRDRRPAPGDLLALARSDELGPVVREMLILRAFGLASERGTPDVLREAASLLVEVRAVDPDAPPSTVVAELLLRGGARDEGARELERLILAPSLEEPERRRKAEWELRGVVALHAALEGSAVTRGLLARRGAPTAAFADVFAPVQVIELWLNAVPEFSVTPTQRALEFPTFVARCRPALAGAPGAYAALLLGILTPDDRAESRRQLDRAVALDPTAAAPRIARARRALFDEDPRAALTDLDAAGPLSPSLARDRTLLAITLGVDLDRALADAKALVGVAPDERLTIVACAHHARGEDAAGLEAARQALPTGKGGVGMLPVAALVACATVVGGAEGTSAMRALDPFVIDESVVHWGAALEGPRPRYTSWVRRRDSYNFPLVEALIGRSEPGPDQIAALRSFPDLEVLLGLAAERRGDAAVARAHFEAHVPRPGPVRLADRVARARLGREAQPGARTR